MNLSQITGIIKAFLPANSPWIERIDQAAQMAKGFSPNKDGISKLMETYGKNRSDLQKAIGMLENPMIKNALSRIPGLGNVLNNAANELMNDPDIGSGQTANNQKNETGSQIASSFDALQARLNRLK